MHKLVLKKNAIKNNETSKNYEDTLPCYLNTCFEYFRFLEERLTNMNIACQNRMRNLESIDQILGNIQRLHRPLIHFSISPLQRQVDIEERGKLPETYL